MVRHEDRDESCQAERHPGTHTCVAVILIAAKVRVQQPEVKGHRYWQHFRNV